MDIYAANTSTTGRITVGETITSEIDTPGDKDWFGVELVAGNRYTFTMSTLPFLREKMQNIAIEGLIAPDGRTVAKGDVPNNSSQNAFITHTALESGLYYIPVRGPIPNTTPHPDGSPPLVELQTGFYTLSVAERVRSTDDHGDAPNAATDLTLGQTVTGNLNAGLPFRQQNDLDWFRIALQEGEVYRLEGGFERVPETGFSRPKPTEIFVFDTQAQKFVLQDSPVAPQTGTYFIKLAATGQYDYTLSVTSPYRFTPEQLAQFERGGGLSEDFDRTFIDRPGRFDIIETSIGNNVVYNKGVPQTLIGGGGQDLMIGTAGFDLLVGDLSQRRADLNYAFQVRALHEIMLGRDMTEEEIALLDFQRAVVEPAGIEEPLVSLWAARIIRSDEFTDRNSPLDPADRDVNATYIRTLYEGLRDGPPSVQDLNTWLNVIANGTGLADVAARFAATPEAFARFGIEHLQGLIETPDATGIGQIYSAYETLLQRTPDATGLEGWAKALTAGRGIEHVIVGIMKSLEYFAKNKQAIVDNPQPVEVQIENALARLSAPDDATLSDFMRDTGADDVLVAGAGNDLLVGGIGSDTFVFAPNEDFNRVLDFESWDTIDLRAFDFDSTDDALAAFRPQDGKAVFNEAGTAIVLYGTEPDMLTQDNFLI